MIHKRFEFIVAEYCDGYAVQHGTFVAFGIANKKACQLAALNNGVFKILKLKNGHVVAIITPFHERFSCV